MFTPYFLKTSLLFASSYLLLRILITLFGLTKQGFLTACYPNKKKEKGQKYKKVKEVNKVSNLSINMSEQGQPQMTATQHLMNANNTLNRKVDKLAETLADLTLGDDLKEYVSDQLAGIRQEGKTRDYKVKDLKPFDGKKQKLRSWLTAANLQLVNKGIEGEERKVRFIGGYLEGLPWDWFEAILRESDDKPRNEWSKRTTRILGSYAEFKKALGQVFGEKNERQTAAEKLQRLRQTGTVTSYITEFQVITSSLDWDSEALEDKYLEGLKPEVGKR